MEGSLCASYRLAVSASLEGLGRVGVQGITIVCIVPLGGERLEQLAVSPADHDDLAASAQLLGDLVHRLLELAHALAAADEQHGGQVGDEAERLLERLLGGQWLGEDRADRQTCGQKCESTAYD